MKVIPEVIITFKNLNSKNSSPMIPFNRKVIDQQKRERKIQFKSNTFSNKHAQWGSSFASFQKKMNDADYNSDDSNRIRKIARQEIEPQQVTSQRKVLFLEESPDSVKPTVQIKQLQIDNLTFNIRNPPSGHRGSFKFQNQVPSQRPSPYSLQFKKEGMFLKQVIKAEVLEKYKVQTFKSLEPTGDVTKPFQIEYDPFATKYGDDSDSQKSFKPKKEEELKTEIKQESKQIKKEQKRKKKSRRKQKYNDTFGYQFDEDWNAELLSELSTSVPAPNNQRQATDIPEFKESVLQDLKIQNSRATLQSQQEFEVESIVEIPRDIITDLELEQENIDQPMVSEVENVENGVPVRQRVNNMNRNRTKKSIQAQINSFFTGQRGVHIAEIKKEALDIYFKCANDQYQKQMCKNLKNALCADNPVCQNCKKYQVLKHITTHEKSCANRTAKVKKICYNAPFIDSLDLSWCPVCKGEPFIWKRSDNKLLNNMMYFTHLLTQHDEDKLEPFFNPLFLQFDSYNTFLAIAKEQGLDPKSIKIQNLMGIECFQTLPDELEFVKECNKMSEAYLLGKIPNEDSDSDEGCVLIPIPKGPDFNRRFLYNTYCFADSSPLMQFRNELFDVYGLEFPMKDLQSGNGFDYKLHSWKMYLPNKKKDTITTFVYFKPGQQNQNTVTMRLMQQVAYQMNTSPAEHLKIIPMIKNIIQIDNDVVVFYEVAGKNVTSVIKDMKKVQLDILLMRYYVTGVVFNLVQDVNKLHKRDLCVGQICDRNIQHHFQSYKVQIHNADLAPPQAFMNNPENLEPFYEKQVAPRFLQKKWDINALFILYVKWLADIHNDQTVIPQYKAGDNGLEYFQMLLDTDIVTESMTNDMFTFLYGKSTKNASPPINNRTLMDFQKLLQRTLAQTKEMAHTLNDQKLTQRETNEDQANKLGIYDILDDNFIELFDEKFVNSFKVFAKLSTIPQYDPQSAYQKKKN